MSSPFPGMDPHLEAPENWHGFHNLMTAELLRQLNPLIVPKYYADIEVHAVLEEVGISTRRHIYPDAAVLQLGPQQPVQIVAVVAPEAPIKRVVKTARQSKLSAVRVFVTETKESVTTIEILSPFNKGGAGLRQYRQKRLRILRSPVHLLEIDLLRSGERPGEELADPPLDTDYVILVNRADDDPRISEIWPVALNEPLPTVPVPLLSPDPDVLLELGRVFRTVYEDAYYALRIDYQQPVPHPSLRPAMATWLAAQRI